jgi:hypothetical protein
MTMPEKAPAEYIVLGLDIIRYSEKKLLLQKTAQERVDHCFNEAVKQCRPEDDSPMPHWIDAGDGGFALFKWAEAEVLDVLIEFYKRLNRGNDGKTEDVQKVLVRSAIHKDYVVAWDTQIAGREVNKFTGHAINNCARLMAGMIKDHEAQAICSRPILDALMAMDLLVSATRLKDIEDKHGHLHEVWNLRISPTLGVDPIAKELHPEPLLRVYPDA